MRPNIPAAERTPAVNQIEMLPVDRLVPYIRNARTHDADQIAQIAASIAEFGFTNPILIGEDEVIIAGHGRLMAAKALGLTEVPVIVLAHLTEAQRSAPRLLPTPRQRHAGGPLSQAPACRSVSAQAVGLTVGPTKGHAVGQQPDGGWSVKFAVFSTKPHDMQFLPNANAGAGYELAFLDVRLGPDVLPLASEAEALCAFVNDDLSAPIIAGFPNALISGDQGLFTEDVPTAIAETTIGNITVLERAGSPSCPVTAPA
jgi:hypothetical protein